MGIYKSWIIMPSLTFEGKRNDIWVLNACYYFHFFHIASNENVGRCKCRIAPISHGRFFWVLNTCCFFHFFHIVPKENVDWYTNRTAPITRLLGGGGALYQLHALDPFDRYIYLNFKKSV
jgi:hypothetical protein